MITYWHVFPHYAPPDADTGRRLNFARLRWANIYGNRMRSAAVHESATTMFRDPHRTLPHVKELVDIGSYMIPQNDVVILTNSDVCSPENIVGMLDLIMPRTDALYSHRRDFPLLTRALTNDEIEAGTFNCGCEFYAFRKYWWIKNSHLMPDMLFGAEAWDWALRHIIINTEKGKMYSWLNLSYHEAHDSVWLRDQNRRTLPSQRHNLQLAYNFEKDYGLNELSIH